MTIKHSVGDKVVIDTNHAYNRDGSALTATAAKLSGTLTVVSADSRYVSVEMADGTRRDTLYHERFLPAPVAAPVPFQKGDTIRALKSSAGSYTKGSLYVVRKDQERTTVTTVLDDVGSRTNGWSASNFELFLPCSIPVPAPVAAPKAETYIIVVQNPDASFAPASKPKTYVSEKQAKAVACKMAEQNPGMDFYVFKAVAKANTPVPAAVFTDL